MQYHSRIHQVKPLLGFFIPGTLTGILLVAPLLVLLFRGACAGLEGYLADPTVLDAARLSIWTSVISLLITLVLGTPLAYILARWSFRYQNWVEMFIDLPIVLPPLVAGIGLLLTFGRNGFLGATFDLLGIRLPFTTAAVILAQIFVSAPLYIRATRLGFANIRPELIEAAYTDGATEPILFWRIMLPLANRSILNGMILSWSRAFGEFGATVIFAGSLQGFTQTMPLAIFQGFEVNLGTALAISLLLIVMSSGILFSLRRVENETNLSI
jgi:molybdate transport system permease protein